MNDSQPADHHGADVPADHGQPNLADGVPLDAAAEADDADHDDEPVTGPDGGRIFQARTARP